MTDFDGRRIVVTGAGGGIVDVTARRLTDRGAHVPASDRTAEGLESLVAVAAQRRCPST